MKTEDIESQLHEQFANNNNSNAGLLMSFITAVVAVFAGYGYTFISTTLSNTFPLIMATATSLIVLLIISILSLEFGTSARRDQFVTHAIRVKAYNNVNQPLFIDINGGVFPDGYHPFCKGLGFCLGIFGTIFWIIHLLSLGICVATWYKLLSTGEVKYNWAPLTIFIVYALFTTMWFSHCKHKYNKTQKACATICPMFNNGKCSKNGRNKKCKFSK